MIGKPILIAAALAGLVMKIGSVLFALLFGT
jgi:hypothetical protein